VDVPAPNPIARPLGVRTAGPGGWRSVCLTATLRMAMPCRWTDGGLAISGARPISAQVRLIRVASTRTERVG